MNIQGESFGNKALCQFLKISVTTGILEMKHETDTAKLCSVELFKQLNFGALPNQYIKVNQSSFFYVILLNFGPQIMQ